MGRELRDVPRKTGKQTTLLFYILCFATFPFRLLECAVRLAEKNVLTYQMRSCRPGGCRSDVPIGPKCYQSFTPSAASTAMPAAISCQHAGSIMPCMQYPATLLLLQRQTYTSNDKKYTKSHLASAKQRSSGQPAVVLRGVPMKKARTSLSACSPFSACKRAS